MLDTAEIVEMENTHLRRRFGRSETEPDGRGARGRSKDPPVLRRSEGNIPLSPIIETDIIWDEFKEVVTVEFPNVVFPDEYMEDNGVVTATIQGATYSDIGKIITLSRDSMKVDVNESKLLVMMDTNKYRAACLKAQEEKIVTKKSFFVYRIITSSKFWVFVLWLIIFGVTIKFIIHNQESYMKLL
jgi:hypothetical protein